jgi:outer membrane lipoprotein SlyB
MKKLFIVLAVATLGFVACNNESKVEEKVEAAADAAKDSLNSIVDSAAVKIDSAAAAVVDSLKK